MFEPDYINLANFMSYEELHYIFKKGESTLIYGLNMDDDGADSNGSGKSAIIKGITVALLGIPDTSLNKEDYIRDGSPRAILRMRMTNNVIKKVIDIERVINRSSSMSVSLWINEEEQDQLTSVAEADKFILDLLDISKEDILNYFIINQDNSHSFFEATDTQQKKVLSRFTNLDPIDQAINLVKIDIAKADVHIAEHDHIILKAESRIESLVESIQYEKEGRINEQESNKQDIKNTLKEEGKNLKELQSKLSEYNEKIKESANDLEELEPVDITYTKDKIEKYEVVLTRIKKDLKESNKLKAELERVFAYVITCPKCGHEWVEDEDADVEEVRENIKMVEELLVQLQESKDKQTKYMEKHEKALKKGRSTNRHIASITSELEDSKESINRFNKRIAASKEMVADLESKLTIIDTISVDRARIKQLGKEVDSERQIVAENEEKVAILSLDQEALKYWEMFFGMKGFKTYLVNTVLDSLEGHVNLHLAQFRTNLKIKINGFRTSKEGNVSEKIDVLVSRDGDSWKKYKRHSGGQRARINVCGILTIHKLINSSSKSGGMNMLLLDEFFEGLDSSGQREILNILQESRITNMVISHNNTDIGATNQSWVRYSNGISSLVGDNRPID